MSHISPLVSIIITSYNKGKTLERAINSAINQSHKNCEVIVVDDCSTDNSYDIITQYQKQINLIKNPNNIGLIASRQVGINNCSGDYITFLDADDKLNRNAIKNCINSANPQTDIIQMKIIQRVTRFNIPISYNCNYNTVRAFDACLYDERLFPIQCCSKLYRRNVILNNEFIKYTVFWGEDRLFNLPIMKNNPNIIYVNNAIYNYYWGGNSNIFNENNIEEYKQVYSIKFDYLNNNEIYIDQMQQEMLNLLEYDIRQRINCNKFSKNEIISWIDSELSNNFWADFHITETPEEIYSRNKKSIGRILKKYIRKIL